jgi:Xaa-Pro aminopeptidase
MQPATRKHADASRPDDLWPDDLWEFKMTAAAARMAALRAAVKTAGLDGWYVGREDMFQGEEVPASEERLAFVSGFTGSAGYGVILDDAAALFSDGRYTLQMASQSDPAFWSTHTLPEASLASWLTGAGADGKQIGVDSSLVTVAGYKRLEKACGDAGATLVAQSENPIDSVWGTARPQRGAARPFRMPDRVAGQSMTEKLAGLDKKLADSGADAVVISRVDAVNWLVNIRGNDLANTPVNLVFALYHRDNGLLILGDVASLAPVMEGDLANEAAIVALEQFDALIDPRAGYGDGSGHPV